MSEPISVISKIAASVNQFLDRVTASYADLRDVIAPSPLVTVQEMPDGRFRRTEGATRGDYVSRRSENLTVIFEPSRFLILTLTLPAGAKPYLKGVITSQIDRISPWTNDHAIFGTEILQERSNTLQVRVAIAARDSIAKRIAQLDLNKVRSLNLRVPTDLDGTKADITIPFESASHRLPVPERRLFAAIFYGAIALAFGVQLLNITNRSTTDDALTQVQNEIATLRDTMGGSNAGQDQKGDPLARMIALKANHIPSVELVDALAAAIPDHTYLTALEYAQGRLHIEGNSTQVTDLPKAIATNAAFGEVTFSAPTAKRRDGDGESFQIDILLMPKHGETP